MGGKSEQTTTQSSTTAPWESAQPMLQNILGQLNPLIQNSGISSAAQGAVNQLTANGQAGNPYAGQIGGVANNLLSGGGATSQAGNISNALSTYTGQVSPYAQPGYSSLNSPALQAALQQVRSDTSNQVNGAFAAAGRDMSGMNQQTLARGIAQAEAPLILNQFNQDTATQQNAANQLYGANNATSSLLGGLQQQQLANQVQGVQTASDALNANNYGPNTVLQAQQLQQQIPASTLGLLAQIGIPIAGLGSQNSGTATTQNQMSGAQQFATILGGIGSLIPKAPMTFNF